MFFGIKKMKAAAGNTHTRVLASYFEIYNEKIFDLLNPQFIPLTDNDEDDTPKRKPLAVREDKKLGVFIEGLRHTHVRDDTAVMAAMSDGLRERTVQATKMNAVSSRSHAVFVLEIVQSVLADGEAAPVDLDEPPSPKAAPPPSTKPTSPRASKLPPLKPLTPPKPPPKPRARAASVPAADAGSPKDDGVQVRSKLVLIDLAGSERAGQQGLQGGRLTEGNNM
jgi:hypothetical protein